MIEQTTRYGMGATVDLPYASAVELVREALAEQGFGVLTEIDMKATLRNKTGADFRPYVILGACNPTLALRALQAERDIGLLLPCNVIVYADDRPERSVIAALDPTAALSLADNTELAEVALAVRERLMAALGQVAEAAGALSTPSG